MSQMDRRKFLGALCASVVAAGVPLPVGLAAQPNLHQIKVDWYGEWIWEKTQIWLAEISPRVTPESEAKSDEP